MITTAPVRSWELDRNPDLVDLVSAARDAGHEVMLIERPMPDAVSVAAIGRTFDIVSATGGVALEDAEGKTIDYESGDDRILGASRLWRRIGPPAAVAVGGFAYRPDRDPGGAWSGFPSLLFRVPALAVRRRRGRTFITAAAPDAESLLDLSAPAARAPAARHLEVTPIRNPLAWTAAVESVAARLRAGHAEKVVLAREVLARGDGVVSAGMVLRGLRAAYPSCFTYLIAGADGTAFAGASPELLVRRSGSDAFAQPMAGSIARGATDAEDERLARQLTQSVKDAVEHRVVANFVIQGGGHDATSYALKPAHENVVNESGNGLQNKRGAVGLARGDAPHSGNAQFYVDLVDNSDLDPVPTRWGYTVFGRILQGLDVIDHIGETPTGAAGPFKSDAPLKPVIIEKMVIVAAGATRAAPELTPVPPPRQDTILSPR